MHRRQWVCEAHKKPFPSTELFTKHIEESHPTALTPRQIRALVNISERAFEEASFIKCPFCPNERQLKMIRNHIAGHMESIALFVLPSTEGDDENDGGEEEPSEASESVNDSEIDLSPAPTGDRTRSATESAETSASEAPWSAVNPRPVSTDDQTSTAAGTAEMTAFEAPVVPENLASLVSGLASRDYPLAGKPASDDELSTRATRSESSEVVICEFEGCPAMFSGQYRQGNLHRHMRNKHREFISADLMCEAPECDRRFKRTDARLKHYRRHHHHLAPRSMILRGVRDGNQLIDSVPKPRTSNRMGNADEGAGFKLLGLR
jgi:hypothetical protein